MRNISSIYLIIGVLMIYNLGASAQELTSNSKLRQPTVEEMATQSSVIVEGNAVEENCFDIKGVRRILYSKVKITKLLKGDISDSVIYVVTDGGICNGAITLVSSGLILEKKESMGVLFLTKDTSVLKYALPFQLYYCSYGSKNFIRYNQNYPAGHRAINGNVYYDDLEKEVFQRIEAITGQKRKVLGKNCFGQ